MSELEKLIKRRGNFKSQLTRFSTYINNLSIDSFSEADRALLQSKVLKLDIIFSDFKNIQGEIIAITDDENAVELESEEFEERFFQAHALAHSLLKDKKVNSIAEAKPTCNSNKVAKPAIHLPTFDGSFDKWYHFRDLFKSMVHSDPSLSQVEKLHYLNTCLKGEAAIILNSMPISDDNYTVAWDILNDRFENKQLIVHSHIHALFNINNTKRDSYKSLRELSDNLNWHLKSLEGLGLPVNSWDALIIYLMSSKLDVASKREWDIITSHNVNELPTFNDFAAFLNKRCRLLGKSSLNEIQLTNKPKISSFLTSSEIHCNYCDDPHSIYQCDEFSKLSANERIAETKKKHLCLNCLGKGHNVVSCKSKVSCKRCNKRHHSLLHLEYNSLSNSSSSTSEPSTSKGVVVAHVNAKDIRQTLLSTACVRAADSLGNWHTCRALLDSGSQSNFITTECYKKLNLLSVPIQTTVFGINQASTSIIKKTEVHLRSRFGSYETKLDFLIIKNITESIPTMSFDASSLFIPNNINLADPTFNEEGKIDMLLGAPIFWRLLCVGQLILGDHQPILHKTRLGWVVSGPLSTQYSAQPSKSLCSVSLNLEKQLEKFWSIEECNPERKLSIQEQECEDHFVTTTIREPEGRFIVSIPFNSKVDNLGESRRSALKRFYALERRLDRDKALKCDYINFMEEYERLGHMRIADEGANEHEDQNYYLPHHAVIKTSSTTTKTRVVFDGSSKTSTGLSLNDVQNTGPVIQDDIFALLLRFRQHTFVVTADIEKMYRQVLISKSDRQYHRILWRRDVSEHLQCYELQTITYGTASASFLSTRCLKQLALEHSLQYPEACTIIGRDFYVDDLLTGGDSIEEVEKLRCEITTILQSAHFNLRKWLSNYPMGAESQNDTQQFRFGDDDSRTLGISWNPQLDAFKYEIAHIAPPKSVTKRSILSTTAKIFDPLGLLAPIIVTAKLILQELWQYQLSWDASVPHGLHRRWMKFADEIASIPITIPRFAFQSRSRLVECHGFADASERAYGACVYVRCLDTLGNCTVNLLCAKSRVAPLRKITLPRLELCAAVLLTDLIAKIRESLSINFDSYFFWSDSTIALCWIKSDSTRWQTFVANRVSKIQSHTDHKDWRHVRSADNPADLLSRGVSLSDLSNSSLWWRGPAWLLKDSSEWPTAANKAIPFGELPELRKNVILAASVVECDLFERFSSLSKLQRITAWILRFANNSQKNVSDRQSGPLSVKELELSLLTLVKIAQAQSYSADIKNLKAKGSQLLRSNLLLLNPFLDSNDILRVGGRIKQSIFTYNKKHPIILPKSHPLGDLIIMHEHSKLLHAGPQAVLSSLRERFWPVSGRSRIKTLIRNCVPCVKSNPPKTEYLMGNLPDYRINPANAFQNSGVDYAGPFLIKNKNGRGNRITKAYICLFICMVTKAIHLELVSALSTDAFLATFRRFISRRGKPANMDSDNGSNFVGAERELRELLQFATRENIQNFSANEGISWHFIPARSPHFGGLWEAGIKSAKNHLRRILHNASLTFEDFSTVLAQVEAVLNSRPISPLSEDPNDLNPLTPGHFLIGRPLVSLPEPSLTDVPGNRLSHYQRLQGLVQHYWTRWSKEYIGELQTRSRWQRDVGPHLSVGTLVILREDHLPPCQWKLGRILQLHPGADGVVRVVTVKTANSNISRSVTKVCALPV